MLSRSHSENNQKILELDKEITRGINNNRFKPSPSARSRLFSPFKWIGHQIRKCFRSIKAAILGYFGLGDNYYTTVPLSQTVTFYLPKGALQNIFVEETPVYPRPDKKSTPTTDTQEPLLALTRKEEEKKHDPQATIKISPGDENDVTPAPQTAVSNKGQKEQKELKSTFVSRIYSALGIKPAPLSISTTVSRDTQKSQPTFIKESLSAFLVSEENEEACEEPPSPQHKSKSFKQ